MANIRIEKIGVGHFGEIFKGITNEHAIEFLLNNKSGEVCEAIHREGFGTIDLVYGENGENGFGLAHIEEQRPGFSKYIPDIILQGQSFQQARDRILFIHDLPHQKRIAVVRLDWNGQDKHWVVTGFGDV